MLHLDDGAFISRYTTLYLFFSNFFVIKHVLYDKEKSGKLENTVAW